MKFQTIEKIRVYKGKYGFSTSFSKNIGTKEKPVYKNEYLNVVFNKENEPKIAQNDSITIMLNSANISVWYSEKTDKSGLQIWVKDYSIVK